MSRFVVLTMTVLLAAHGLVHSLGFAAYFRLVKVEGLPYRTTVLGGRVDIGDLGMRVVGAAFLLAGVGFAVVAYGCWTEASWWRMTMLATTLLSLVLTSLEWDVAYAGTVVDLVILAGMGITRIL